MDELLNLFGETEPSKFWNLIADPRVPTWPIPHIPCSVDFSPDHVHWAFQDMPIQHADKHFLVAGASGSGKTTLIRLFLQSIVPRIQKGANEQIIIYDAKGDVLPMLSGLGLNDEGDNVWVMNPFDVRGRVWSIAEAMQSPAMARYLGTMLVPAEEHSSAPFFWQASRELLWAVTVALSETRRADWTLRDLICAFDDRKFVLGVCKALARSQSLANTIFADEKHALGVLTTLLTKLGPFHIIASLWHTHSDAKKFSVQEFLSKPGVLVLGHDDVYKDSINPLNAMLLRALTDEILRRPDHSGSRHWFILDEFPAMGKTDFVTDLMDRGRSKGASALLGIQNIGTLNKLYGPDVAESILANCANKVFIRAGGPQMAKWMESYFGNIRSTERQWGRSETKGEVTTSETWSTVDRPQFNSSYFTSLRFPEQGGLFDLVADGPGTGPVIATRRFNEVLSWLRPYGDASGSLPRDTSLSQILKPWDDTEIELNCGKIEKAGQVSSNKKETSLENTSDVGKSRKPQKLILAKRQKTS